jgi:translocation and assembly module TamA
MTLKLGASIYRDDTDAYEETGAQVRVDLERRIGKTDFRTYGVTAGVSRDEERVESNGVVIPRRRELATVAGLVAWSIDRSNDPLNPVRGWRLEWRAEPIAHTGDDTLAYLRAQAQGSVYVPFDEKAKTVAAARLKFGAIAGGRIPEVPASRRFYAGGGGSVRGYAYQAVGPRFSDNTPQGGLSLVEGSVELRRKVVGAWTGVAFVDAGILGDRSAIEFDDPAVGVGVGVRYDLGFAPLRADIGVPLNKRQGDSAFQIYLSVGQSF